MPAPRYSHYDMLPDCRARFCHASMSPPLPLRCFIDAATLMIPTPTATVAVTTSRPPVAAYRRHTTVWSPIANIYYECHDADAAISLMPPLMLLRAAAPLLMPLIRDIFRCRYAMLIAFTFTIRPPAAIRRRCRRRRRHAALRQMYAIRFSLLLFSLFAMAAMPLLLIRAAAAADARRHMLPPRYERRRYDAAVAVAFADCCDADAMLSLMPPSPAMPPPGCRRCRRCARCLMLLAMPPPCRLMAAMMPSIAGHYYAACLRCHYAMIRQDCNADARFDIEEAMIFTYKDGYRYIHCCHVATGCCYALPLLR